MDNSVLVINENRDLSPQLSKMLSTLGYTEQVECPQQRVMSRLSEGSHPLFAVLNMTDSATAALKVLKYIREMDSALPLIVVGMTTQIRAIVEAVQLGACDYIIVPLDEQQVRLAIRHVVENCRREDVKSFSWLELFDTVTTSPEMSRAKRIARMVGPTDVPVLISGESGVGKEIFARYLHSQSPRASKPLLKVNCAALPNDLLESELFGYERGAFTGAIAEKPGKFELADGGAILLDEIGEMSPHLQAKLLHVLQDGEYSRLGGKRQLRVDTRILAATNKELEDAVSRGEFRDDLYFRLNVIRIKIPPLRHRKQEILALCNYFVEKYRDKYGSPVEELPLAVLHRFMEYDWPGNVRQLENAVRRYLILSEVDIELESAPKKNQNRFRRVTDVAPATPALPDPSTSTSVPEFPAEFSSLKQVGELAAERAERELVLWMLAQTNWNRKLAADRLNVCYKVLLRKIKKWQIHRPPASSRNSHRAIHVHRMMDTGSREVGSVIPFRAVGD